MRGELGFWLLAALWPPRVHCTTWTCSFSQCWSKINPEQLHPHLGNWTEYYLDVNAFSPNTGKSEIPASKDTSFFLMPQSNHFFLPANLSGSLQIKDFVWFLVQILVLETASELIRTCWILKYFGQRKDLEMSPEKTLSCLPHETIKDHNLSRVRQLYSLECIYSYASITWICGFLPSRCNSL